MKPTPEKLYRRALKKGFDGSFADFAEKHNEILTRKKMGMTSSEPPIMEEESEHINDTGPVTNNVQQEPVNKPTPPQEQPVEEGKQIFMKTTTKKTPMVNIFGWQVQRKTVIIGSVVTATVVIGLIAGFWWFKRKGKSGAPKAAEGGNLPSVVNPAIVTGPAPAVVPPVVNVAPAVVPKVG